MAGTGSIQVAKVTKVGTIESTHQYDVTLKFDIAFDYGGKNNTGAANYNIACDGQNQGGHATFNIPSGGGNWVWGNIASKTFRIAMPTSGKSKTINFSAAINTGITPSYISASGSYTLPAVYWQWTVSYNANGGSGAPDSQTKTYNANLTLSNTIPTKAGYMFKGWSTSSTATTATYAAGGTYSANESVTLYAVWEINTYTVSYDANGGSGAPDSQTKIYNTNLDLSSTLPVRANYNFKGWSTSSTATTATYAAGGTYSANESVTLYAVWELAYWNPKITGALISRCELDGTNNEYGTYAKLTFEWECCQIIGENNVESIVVKYAPHSTTTFTSTSIPASGTSGTVDTVVGSGNFSTDSVYDIVITVTDSKEGSSSLIIVLGAAEFTMDFLSGGKGVAIGKPSETENLFDVGWKTKLSALEVNGFSTFNNYVNMKNIVKIDLSLYVDRIESQDLLTISSKKIKMEPTESLTYNIPVVQNADCNTLTSSGIWYIGDTGTNTPLTENGWLDSKQYSTDYCHQTYITSTGKIYKRIMSAGAWGSWIGGMGNMHKLWSGTLSSGGTVSIPNLDLYDIFLARTSDGSTMMAGFRHYDEAKDPPRRTNVRFIGGYDSGNESLIFKANTDANGNTFKSIACSKHKLSNSGIVGTVLTIKALWGVS